MDTDQSDELSWSEFAHYLGKQQLLKGAACPGAAPATQRATESDRAAGAGAELVGCGRGRRRGCRCAHDMAAPVPAVAGAATSQLESDHAPKIHWLAASGDAALGPGLYRCLAKVAVRAGPSVDADRVADAVIKKRCRSARWCSRARSRSSSLPMDAAGCSWLA